MNEYTMRDILIYTQDEFQMIGICSYLPYVTVISDILMQMKTKQTRLHCELGTESYVNFPLTQLKVNMREGQPVVSKTFMGLESLLQMAGYYNLPKLIEYLFSIIGPNPYDRSRSDIYDEEMGCFMATLTGSVEGNHHILFEYLLTQVKPESQEEFRNDHLLDNPFQSALENENLTILKMFHQHGLIHNINMKMTERVIHEHSNPELVIFYNEYVDPRPDWSCALDFAIKNRDLPLYYRSMTETIGESIRVRTVFFLYAFCPLPADILLTLGTRNPKIQDYDYKNLGEEHDISLKMMIPILKKVQQEYKYMDNNINIYRYWQGSLKGACYSGNTRLISKIYRERSLLESNIDKDEEGSIVVHDIVIRNRIEYFNYGIYLNQIMSCTKISDEACWETLDDTIDLFYRDPIEPITKDQLMEKALMYASGHCRPLVVKKIFETGYVYDEEYLDDCITNFCEYYYPRDHDTITKAKELVQLMIENGGVRCNKRWCFHVKEFPEVHPKK
jgi:hypothetical protein